MSEAIILCNFLENQWTKKKVKKKLILGPILVDLADQPSNAI